MYRKGGYRSSDIDTIFSRIWYPVSSVTEFMGINRPRTVKLPNKFPDADNSSRQQFVLALLPVRGSFQASSPKCLALVMSEITI